MSRNADIPAEFPGEEPDEGPDLYWQLLMNSLGDITEIEKQEILAHRLEVAWAPLGQSGHNIEQTMERLKHSYDESIARSQSILNEIEGNTDAESLELMARLVQSMKAATESFRTHTARWQARLDALSFDPHPKHKGAL